MERNGVNGVDFNNVGRKHQIIEIALSICALGLHPTFWEAFYWRKSWAQGADLPKGVGRKNSLWYWPQVVKKLSYVVTEIPLR